MTICAVYRTPNPPDHFAARAGYKQAHFVQSVLEQIRSHHGVGECLGCVLIAVLSKAGAQTIQNRSGIVTDLPSVSQNCPATTLPEHDNTVPRTT